MISRIAHRCLSCTCHSILIVCLDVCHWWTILLQQDVHRPVLNWIITPHMPQQWQQGSCYPYSGKGTFSSGAAVHVQYAALGSGSR